MDAPTRRRPLWRRLMRFSLAGFLFVVACLAGYLGGYREGVRRGTDDKAAAAVTTRIYDVADLIRPLDEPLDWVATEEDFAELIELITSTITAESWGPGQGGSINAFPKNRSLVIANRGVVHDEIDQLFGQIRRLRYTLPDGYLEDVREVAARQEVSATILKATRQEADEVTRQFQAFFESAEADLHGEFGSPSLMKEAGDVGFPEWIGARRVAVWNKGSGKLYLALRDCRPRGEALVFGWWEPSAGEIAPMSFASNP